MDVYLPIAKLSINGVWLIGLGVISGFLTGMFGTGGGFVMTPLLVFIGVPPGIAVGTQACQLTGTTLSGAMAHWHRRQIDIRMALVMLSGSLIGAGCGIQLFKWLEQAGYLSLTITLGYTLLLGAMGGIMMRESISSLKHKPSMLGAAEHDPPLRAPLGANWPLKINFPVSDLRISALAPISIGFICGMMVSIFGVGSGFVLIPAMLYLLRMPANLVSGTALFKIIFVTGFATVLQAMVTHSVDIVLAFFLLGGSVFGAQLGARYAQRLRPEVARFLLASLILIVALKLCFGLVVTPVHPFSLEMKFP